MAHDRAPLPPGGQPVYGSGPSNTTPYPAYDEGYPDPRAYHSPNVEQPYFMDPSRSRSRANSIPRPYSNDLPYTQQAQPVYDAVDSAFDKTSAPTHVPDAVIQKITEQVRSQVINTLKKEGFAGAAATSASAYTFPPPPLQPFMPPQSPTTSTTNSISNSRNLHTPPSPHRRDSTRASTPDAPAQDPLFFESAQDFGKEDLSMRYGDRTEDVNRRPDPPRVHSGDEETVVEKMWQQLFDTRGEPTARLGQFLRGLALHLIEDYEPKKSLVISPTKLRQFYQDINVQEDTYPWTDIFRLPNASISKIYRELNCQHHFIQINPNDVPDIPALTPDGFQRWYTLMIQAHPQAEFDRLSIAVRDMPISNADDRKERFPKELSRRLLPKRDNDQVRQLLGAALQADGQIKIPKHTLFPPPPPQTQPSSFGERVRAPYSAQVPKESSQPSSCEDKDKKSFSMPIERERKPYTAKEGQGKTYKDDSSSTSSSTLKGDSSRRRAKSIVGDRDSVYSDPGLKTDNHQSSYSKSSARRRSPTRENGHTRPDGTVGDGSSSWHSSSTYKDDRSDDRYTRESERPRDRDRDRDRSERDRERERDREIRDRERDARDREREAREREEEYARRAAEEEYRRAEEGRRFSRYEDNMGIGGEPLGRRPTTESSYSSNGYPSYPPPPVNGEARRYG
ncbi:hypothetical protein BLS_005471 [Venturia inaequalis]|uniref:DUF7514 domain-containing protein n=1 Tax=Venturia inaequalis TaxID=5025 RepID=A0A8H3V7J8_VENIN|nr:hypothetical protein BLS_005471 [Venturia inaequalis]KAE9982830.1 hypothetical protein EG328_010569 [Venturia inaequalis]